MARVVQRRTTPPPYLLILFVFLTAISAILAAIFYTGKSDQVKLVADLQKKNADLTEKKDKLTANDGEIDRLIYAVTGKKGQGLSVDAAVSDAKASLGLKESAEYANTGLAEAVRSLDAKIQAKDTQLRDLDSRVRSLQIALVKSEDTVKQVEKNLTAKLDAANSAVTAAVAKTGEVSKDKDDQLAKTVAEKNAKLAEKDQEKTVTIQEMDAVRLELQQKDIRINELLAIIPKIKPHPDAGSIVLQKPDGKVAKVVLDQNVCYINLGERDRVVPGLPFSVFAGATIPETAKPKAKLVVTSVGPTTSECRVTEAVREDPLLEGDAIMNVAYNPTRAYNFVVEGDFDLYAEGRVDPQGLKRVQALIESMGGKVQDEMSVNTDFLVVGEDPRDPPKPAEDAQPATWQIYNESKKRYEHYKSVVALAKSLQIPILNTSRFLAYTGFVPKKRLTE